MIRDITIGQYYPVDSIIHRLDPRVKLLGTLLYIISLFLFDSFAGYLLVIGFIGSVILASKVPLSYIFKGLKAVIFLLLFTVVFNVFFTQGDNVIGEVVDFPSDLGRVVSRCVHGNPYHLVDHRFFHHDVYNDAESAYGWFRDSTSSTKPNQGASA